MQEMYDELYDDLSGSLEREQRLENYIKELGLPEIDNVISIKGNSIIGYVDGVFSKFIISKDQ